MFDLQNERVCPHQIFDEKLSLQGGSPNYFASLKYISNRNTNAIEIREFATTNSLTNYSYTINGFTNWALSADGRQINFNSLGLGGPGTGVASFADGSSLINPVMTFLITYLTLDSSCPLHETANSQSSPIQRDININTQGRFDIVTSTAKVRQEVLKAIRTYLNANKFHAGYGSLLSNLIGSKFDIFAQFQLQRSIQDAVDFLIQQQQLLVNLPIDETIFRVSTVDVNQDTTDPRTIKVVIKVLTGSYQEVTITFGMLT